MRFIKSDDGERVDAVSEDGTIVAYIKKQRMGTHGHWRGWTHYAWCERTCDFVACNIWESVIYPERPQIEWKTWTEEPPWFGSVLDFKTHYERKG